MHNSRVSWVLHTINAIETGKMVQTIEVDAALKGLNGWIFVRFLFYLLFLRSSAIEQRLTENYTLLNRKQITESAKKKTFRLSVHSSRSRIHALEFLWVSSLHHIAPLSRTFIPSNKSNSSSKYHSSGACKLSWGFSSALFYELPPKASNFITQIQISPPLTLDH